MLQNYFSNKYPYTDFHELNLDWIINQFKEMSIQLEKFVSLNTIKYADPIQWDITTQYETNTIVVDPITGSAYISVQPVPTGISLSNTDYWSIVFDFSRFVVKMAQNLASVYEPETTTSATVSSSYGDWIVWGDVLYRNINANGITAGDTYVVGGNIQRITVEEVIGHVEDLDTSNKTNLVSAINEVLQLLTDTTGDLTDLVTTDKSNLVSAINEVANEVLGKIGDLNDLVTDDKSNLVSAINEVDNNLTSLAFQTRVTYHAVYIDPINGDDSNDGLTTDTPMKSCDSAILKYPIGSLNIYPLVTAQYEVHRSLEGLLQFEISNPLGIPNVIFNVSNYAESKRLKYGSNGDSVGMTFNLSGDAVNPANCRVEIYHATINGSFKPQACNTFISNCVLNSDLTVSQGDTLLFNSTFNAPISISYGRLRTNGSFVFNSDNTQTGQAYIYINGGYWDCPNPTSLTGSMLGSFTYGILLSGGMITFASQASYNSFETLLGEIHSFRGLIAIGALEMFKNCPSANDVRYYQGGFQNYITATNTWNYLTGQVRHVSTGLQYYDGTNWVNIP